MPSGGALSLISDFWNSNSPQQQRTYLASAAALALCFYLFLPSIFPSSHQDKMFTKRPDKYTTGLINLRNDCFANLSLQAYLSLPGMTNYLNAFIGTFRALQRLVPTISEELQQASDSKTSDKSDKPEKSGKSRFTSVKGIPLHIALAKILKKLQETELTSRTVSVWTFLHELEKIFRAKILRSQHDAHELTQLINETLENENIWFKNKVQELLEDKDGKVNKNFGPVVKEQLNLVEVPDFPLNGLILTQMVCLKCKNRLKPHFAPFSMLTLPTPEKFSTELQTIIDENEQESIEGYQCLNCRVHAIANNEKRRQANGQKPSDSETLLTQAIDLANDSNLYINEDLNSELEEFIKNYNKNGLKTADITLTVLRSTMILKPPKILGLHLLRSQFNGTTLVRNACRVSFEDRLTLLIGSEYKDDLQQLQNAATATSQHAITLNVLTTDVNDMEDENVQREDVDVKGSNDENLAASDDEAATFNNEGVASDSSTSDLFNLDSDLLGETSVTASESTVGTLNKAPISREQSIRLKSHFKAFKFNDDDLYKYKLRAVIKHQGSHTQGHYECYKKKPLFVKDKEGTIFKLSPEIDASLIEEEDSIMKGNFEFDKKSSKDSSKEDASSVDPKTSDSGGPSTEAQNDSSNDGMLNIHGDFRPSNGTFRRKFSNMMGKRPSIVVKQTKDENIQELIDSGLTTPHELIVDSGSGYNSANRINKEGEDYLNHKSHSHRKLKLKKIPSLIKFPYWRISDAQVVETARSLVLLETTAVYMLYYERVERKQIHKHTR